MTNRKRILITGASGLVGTALTRLLLEKGYEICHLSRTKSRTVETFLWNTDSQTIEEECLDGVSTIIHLAGANVSEKRWTARRKKEIIDSRVKSTDLLLKTLQSTPHTVTTFISASAIGFYGFKNPETIFTEESHAGNDFLATVTREWEDAVDRIRTLNIRTVKMRIGVVLAKDGGALKPISQTVKFGIGAPLGSGDQFISWIHVHDLCQMFSYVIEHQSIVGAVNAVAPLPVTNKELTKAIAKKLRKPMFMPAVPSFALRFALGEMADIVLEGSRVSADKIIKAGFRFRFGDVHTALDDLLKNQYEP